MPKTDVVVQLTGQDGNVFSVIGQTSKALKRAGHNDLAKEYSTKCLAAQSYDEVLQLTMATVEVQ